MAESQKDLPNIMGRVIHFTRAPAGQEEATHQRPRLFTKSHREVRLREKGSCLVPLAGPKRAAVTVRL